MNIVKHRLGENEIWYLIDDKKRISMLLLPHNTSSLVKENWYITQTGFDARAEYNNSWRQGSLVYFKISGMNMDSPGLSMKSESLQRNILYESQEIKKREGITEIVTNLRCEQYKLVHTVKHIKGLKGFECTVRFINCSNTSVKLEMLSSFALDNLSPFQGDDASDKYNLHRFYGGWSLEGKHSCMPIEELALEKAWVGFNGANEKFGSRGSYPVERYFPTAVVEDKEHGVFWAAQLACNSTWQMELSRQGDTLSFTGGLGDRDFCGWSKCINSGEEFVAPTAYIAAVKGDIYDACSAVVDMQKTAYLAYGENGLPVTFNEYCSTWGTPTQEKILRYCDALKNRKVKYLVIDAGWCKAGCEQSSNGEWIADKNIFPDMKEMNAQIRQNGMIPGIWFELEVTTNGSLLFEDEYSYMHLKKDGNVIKTGNFRSYWDFRRDDVKAYLKSRVIDMLKENGFGYIKVDYNGNIGIGIDGKESGAEELREHLKQVRDFFETMKKEIPELIIENCASGGHRLEPSMLGVSAMSSFSDVHEGAEIPYIAANLHSLVLPSQLLVWAVLHSNDSMKRQIYSLTASFLGRICLSGEVDALSYEQNKLLDKALFFYENLKDIIINGTTKIYGNRGRNTRYPAGVQIVFRYTDTEAYIVCHAFRKCDGIFEFEMPGLFKINKSFGDLKAEVSGHKVIIRDMEEMSAFAVYMKLIN